MGRSIDLTELKYRYKLSTTFPQDAMNEEEFAQEITEMNENIAEMVQAIEELNSQLQEYVRALTESVERFRQIFRNQVTDEISRAFDESNHALAIMTQNLETENFEEHEGELWRQPQENRMMGVIHNRNEQIRLKRAFPHFQNQERQEEGFFKRAFRHVSNGIINFMESFALST